MDDTIRSYDQGASEFAERTFSVRLTEQMERLSSRLGPGAHGKGTWKRTLKKILAFAIWLNWLF